MNRFIQTAIVIGAGFVLWQVSADARFLDLKEQKQSPNLEIASKPTYKTKTKGIRVPRAQTFFLVLQIVETL
jgi:hypothetical protein